MGRLVLSLIAAILATSAFGSIAGGQSPPEFKLGFKYLADQIPQVIGEPLENEHSEANGDSLQRTTTGLMVWRKADNWTAFTDGSRTWINGPFGLQVRGNEDRFEWETASVLSPNGGLGEGQPAAASVQSPGSGSGWPSSESVLQRYRTEVRPLAERLQAAQRAPAGFRLPSPESWRIALVPLSDRLYYVQTLLFPDWALGEADAPTRLYVAYSYERGAGLGRFALRATTQEVKVRVRVVTQVGETLRLLEGQEGVGGSGSTSEGEMVRKAVDRPGVLGDLAGEVEESIEAVVAYATGLDWWSNSLDLRLRVTLLEWALSSQHWADRKQAAEWLGEMRARAKDAIPALVKALEDENEVVRDAAVVALARIGTEALQPLVQALRDPGSRRRLGAATAMGKIGPPAREVVPALIDALKDWNADVRKAASDALKAVTGQDFGQDPTAWQRWWAEQR